MDYPSQRTGGVDINRQRPNSQSNNSLNVLNNDFNVASSYQSNLSTISKARRFSTARLAGSPLTVPPGQFNISNGDDFSPRGRTLNPMASHPESPSLSTSHGSNKHQFLANLENPNFVSEGKDKQSIMDETISRYVNDNMNSEGGDIKHDLKLQNNKMTRKDSTLRRTRSFTDLEMCDERRGSTASALNVPGGFRREFIVNKHRQLAILNDEELTQVPFFTKNFMEFLYIYGHFAGETFDEDFDLWTETSGEDYALADSTPTERTPLVDDGKPSIPTRYEARGTTSTLKAFFIMLKAFIGTGVLFLPKAFDNGGLLFSIISLSVFGIYSFYCYYILVLAKDAVKVSSFGDIGFRLYGKNMRVLILASLVLTQVGFTCAYIIFTSENLSAFLRNTFGWDFDQSYIYVFQVLLFIPLSFIRNVSKLSLPAFLANIFILVGLVIVLFFSSLEIFNNGVKDSVELYINKSKFSIFIGTAIFAFEGIGLIIPIQDSMKHPERFPLVLGLVIMTISLLMMTIAITGYLAYGADIQTVILLNLPQGNLAVRLIQFFYSVAILLSIPLQIFPAIAIIEQKIVFGPSSSGKHNTRIKWLKNLFRSIFVIGCVSIAWYGADNLDKFVSFVGCFACIPLVYMYPPLFHLKINPEKKYFNYLLLVIGFFAMVYTSYQIIFG